MEIKEFNDAYFLMRTIIAEKKEIKTKQLTIKQCEDRLTELFEQGKLKGESNV